MTRYSKFIAAALAFAGVVASSGLLTGKAEAWANCVIAAIGAALVYLLPNQPAPTRNQSGHVAFGLGGANTRRTREAIERLESRP